MSSQVKAGSYDPIVCKKTRQLLHSGSLSDFYSGNPTMFDLTTQNTIVGSMSDNRADFDSYRLSESIEYCEDTMLNEFG